MAFSAMGHICAAVLGEQKLPDSATAAVVEPSSLVGVGSLATRHTSHDVTIGMELTMKPVPGDSSISRRRALYFAAIGPIGVALGACGNDSEAGPTATPTTTATQATTVGDGNATPDCVLTPEEIEGPFYTDVNLMRRDITDNKPGVALELQLTIVDADTCSAISDATVDVWHADAGGLYSAFPGQGDDGDIDNTGQSFLRGTQTTDANGTTTFSTVYPGWYRGRTTHIHIKVHFDNNTRVTSQLYFPDEVTAAAYATDAYHDRGPKDTANETDDFSAANPDLRMSVIETGGSYLATHTIGIRR